MRERRGRARWGPGAAGHRAVPERGGQASPRRQRGHPGREVQPADRRARTCAGAQGYYDPLLFEHGDLVVLRARGDELLLRRADGQDRLRRLELRRGPGAAHRRLLPTHLGQRQDGHEQHVPDPQPALRLGLQPRPHPAASPELQDRLRAAADPRRQEEPRDLGPPVQADRDRRRGQRQAALLRPHLRDRQPRGGEEEPGPGAEAPRARTRSGSRWGRWRRSTWCPPSPRWRAAKKA